MTALPQRPLLVAYLCLAASMALVGSYVGLSKLLLGVFPVFLLAGLRFGIAAVSMATWLRRPPEERPLSRPDRALLFWESFLGNFLFSICMLYGVALSSALSAGVVMAGIPATVAILSRIFLKEQLGPRTLAAVGCAAVGIALMALARAPDGEGAPAGLAWETTLGHALLVGAMLCEASYVVIGKRLAASLSPRRISALINLWGLGLMMPFALWQAAAFDFAAVPAPIWLLLLFYSLAASMATVWLWMKGLRQVPAARAGVFTVMLPITAALVGIVVLGEPFGAVHAAAFGLAIAGLLLATWPTRDRA